MPQKKEEDRELKRLEKEVQRCHQQVMRDEREVDVTEDKIGRLQATLVAVREELVRDKTRLEAAEKALADAKNPPPDPVPNPGFPTQP